MTEQTTTGGTRDIAALFTELAGRELEEIIEDELASVSAEELVKGFREATQVMDGLLVMGETMNQQTYTVLSDAARRANEGLRRAKALESRA